MKFTTLIVALCAVLATSNAQDCANLLGRSFQFYQVEQVCQNMLQYGSYSDYWQYVFPQFDQDLAYWSQTIGSYATMDFGLGADVQEKIFRHVVEYRQNYTDFPISVVNMVAQHKDWAFGNFSFLAIDVATFLVEFDSALKLADEMMSQRPECGMSDRSNFISQATSNMSNTLQMTTSYLMSSNSYLYSIVSHDYLSTFQNMFSMAVMDLYSPILAIEQIELYFLEATRSLVRKQTENLSNSLNWYINTGLLQTLTNQRVLVLSVVQNVDEFQCYGQ